MSVMLMDHFFFLCLGCFVLPILPNEPAIGSPNGRGYLCNFRNVTSAFILLPVEHVHG
jgi:hypothetical protein